MGKFKGKWRVEEHGPRKIKLLSPISYTTNKGITHTAPEGFVSDGASIPAIFWIIIGSPFMGKYRRPVITHDLLYATQNVRRRYADRVFLEGMKDDLVSWWKRRAMYLGVRSGGWWPWYRHAKRLKKEKR
ncbi:hypothetical protein LCGC14_1755700 [marine sediment metagenome]|uniref:DUF1353 domain-containing protein n=1 Tax=marine sediment metagenome TaxID=412755 RepID=A0A0F9H2N3_9ZZZZ